MVEEFDDIPTVEFALECPYIALVQCRLAQENANAQEIDHDNRIASAAYAITKGFEQDSRAWRKAVVEINKSGWIKPKIKRDKDFLKIREKICFIIFRHGRGFSYHKAYKMARALHYCGMKGVEAKNALGYIQRNGGIKGLSTADMKEFPRRDRKQGKDMVRGADAEALKEFMKDLMDDPPVTDEDRIAALEVELESVIERLTQIDGRDRVVMEVDPGELPWLFSMRPGKCRSYKIRRSLSAPGKWIPLIGSRIQR